MYGCIKQASIHLTTSGDRPVYQTLNSGQDDKLSAPDGAIIEKWLKPD
jgi:hypothetical protein